MSEMTKEKETAGGVRTSPLPQKRFTNRQLWRVAFPILVSILMEQLIGMTDAAFLGRVGEVELGASALGGIFYIAIFMLGFGFAIGAQILMGRRNGEGRYAEIGHIFYHGMGFLMLVAAVLFLLTHFFGSAVMNAIVSSGAVAEAADSYLVWRAYGFFFAFAGAMFRAFYVGTTNTRTLTLNSLTMVLSNVVFNYILIFGKFGIPAFGIAGAAMGSVLAEAVSVVFFIAYTRRRVDCARYGLNAMPRFRAKTLRSMLSLSVWTMVQNFLSLATWFIFFLSVEHLGEHALAATNVVRNISGFTFMTITALGSTASTLTSNLMGQGEPGAVMPLLRQTVRLTFGILTPVLILIGLFPSVVMGIFTNDALLMDSARPALYVLLTSYVLTIPAQIYFHAVSATGNTRAALRLELFSLGIYTVYVVVAIFTLRVSLAACWASEFVYSALCFAQAYAYMRRGRWMTKRI